MFELHSVIYRAHGSSQFSYMSTCAELLDEMIDLSKFPLRGSFKTEEW